MKKLISFDLDQTLVETTKAHALSFKKAFQIYRIKINEKKIEKFIDGRHSRLVILAIFPGLDKTTVQKIRHYHHEFLKKTIKYAKPMKNVLKILKKLKKSYNLALLTNCDKTEAELLLKASRIPKKIFNVIILASQVRHPKPFPDEIFKAEKITHVKSDIHVGDSVYDVIAAKKAKAISIAVLSGQSTKKQLKKYKPDFIIKSISQLPRVLEKIEKN